MDGINRLIDAVMKCVKCGAAVGKCDCWEKCSCGWSNSRGKFCRNPNTIRCSSKLKYGQWNRSTRVYDPKPGCEPA